MFADVSIMSLLISIILPFIFLGGILIFLYVLVGLTHIDGGQYWQDFDGNLCEWLFCNYMYKDF